MSFRYFSAAVCFILWGATTASADIRALLVGVSDYDEAAKISDLQGPGNDVRLIRDTLQKRGAEDIVIVASDVEGASLPTLEGIEAGFAEVTSRATKGDLVYIHLSGHGTRQLDLEGDETDGLDEVFLPSDVRVAEPGTQIIPNALTDDRIGALVAGIRAKGADVWLVMDSCHSGSGMRSGGLTAERQVNPAALNIDIRAAKPQAGVTEAAPPLPADAGSYLAFYATRSNDVAREGDLSRGGQDPQWYGLFTSTLAARLDSGLALTYRQLFQAVLSDMNRNTSFGASAIQTPLWEGTLIDAPVFGGKGSTRIPRYLTEFDKVKAGLVHGLQAGTMLALVEDISAAPDEVIGYAQVEEADARDAFIRMVDANCLPKADALCPAIGTIPKTARFAQVELHPIDRRITFSPVLNFETGATLPQAAKLSTLFADAVTANADQLGIVADISGTAYDVQVVLRDGGLWFGPATAIGSEPVGHKVAKPEANPRPLSEAVRRILRAEQLAKTLDLLDGGGAIAAPIPVALDVQVFPSTPAQLIPPGQTMDVEAECGPVGQAAMQARSTDAFSSMAPSGDLKQCDVLRFTAQNEEAGQRDVNRIHIDAQYCVHVNYELVEGAKAAREVGAMMQMCSDCPGNAYSAGHERLYFLVSELEENGEALNLQGLVENCAGETRDARGAVAREMLRDLSRTGATRGAMGLFSAGVSEPNVWVQSYRWRVLPRAEVFREAGLLD
ncbi:caspase family protein [Lentibacter sp. XHP0401]|uniref:caspase family protein n=1 Tax=Lentibacter sp. XHP0401 TaxID=2984334 RepID=UPI0021E8805F|nr:caspase family protein [Lentibacter sp. XHP0401]MCV2894624.1 caspase family protein [Lentibacter sp. XHP0401]